MGSNARDRGVGGALAIALLAIALLVPALLAPARASAQKALIVNLLYESPSLAAPAVLLASTGADGRAWRVGLAGWTVAGEVSRQLSSDRTILAGARLTPLNANGSNRMFRDGIRSPGLDYENAAAAIAVGARYHPSRAWSSEIRLVGQYERVANLPDPVLERWRQPYVGVELAQSYQRITAEDPLRFTLQGMRVQGRVEGFVGSAAWGRATASVDAGHAFGPLLLRGTAAYMLGHEIDTVSAFLIGGSWDAPGVHALYGHPYAAFRIARGALLRGAADIPLPGDWSLGIRGAHLASPGAVHSGGMVRVGTTMDGVSGYVGAAFPVAQTSNDHDAGAGNGGGTGGALFILGLSAAVLQ